MLDWVRDNRTRVAVVFEGRDAVAGSQGIDVRSSAIQETPQLARVSPHRRAPEPTEREKSQW